MLRGLDLLDVVHSGMDIAILDTSATAHMPDTLEMPYRPEIVGAGPPASVATTAAWRTACLAGDVIGDYSFDRPLQPGDRLVFRDMAHYTMVKTTTFNGVRLPSIASSWDGAALRVHRRFGYTDFASPPRLTEPRALGAYDPRPPGETRRRCDTARPWPAASSRFLPRRPDLSCEVGPPALAPVPRQQFVLPLATTRGTHAQGLPCAMDIPAPPSVSTRGR
ncbi:MAG: hypothetical protein U0168_31165 [Nannocystaceae bacterium]